LEKVHYLEDCIKSLPDGSEIVLVETIKDEEKEGLQDVTRLNNVIQAKYYYKEWDYSKARNAAKSLCTRQIIFSIDSDERLSQHQHTAIIKAAIDLNKSDFGGLKVRNISIAPLPSAPGSNAANISEQVRICKNIPQIHWQFSVHENLEKSMRDNGLQYADSNILINHIGYDTKPEILRDKHITRLNMLLADKECHSEPLYFQYVINESLSLDYYNKVLERN
jgi:hypothetical protein